MFSVVIPVKTGIQKLLGNSNSSSADKYLNATQTPSFGE